MTNLVTAALMGVVEGLTEYVPVSSTGHLILAGKWFGLPPEVEGAFEIFIQAGAILAVIVAYPGRFAGFFRRGAAGAFAGGRAWLMLALTTLPAALAGLLLHPFIEAHLFTPKTVAVGLAVGAVWMLLAEHRGHPDPHKAGVDSLTWRDALRIGCFQCLALWPGMSRSASTILGGMALGVDRKTATEYSFFAAVPLLGLASVFALIKGMSTLSARWIPFFAAGLATSFVFGWISIRFLVHFLGRHRLDAFAWYRLGLAALVLWLATARADAAMPGVAADVCVYGATPGGILAAVAVKREGRSVVIVEPGRWVGGMLGAGLKPMQDCPNYAATGGLTRKLLRTLGSPEWDGDRLVQGTLSRVSPKQVREDFAALLREHGIEVIFDHRVASCEKRGGSIVAAVFDLAPFDELGCPPAEPAARADLRVEARVFIDASYEGDLMPAAGVTWRVGRESADEYGEPHAGVQPPMEDAPIDPFVVPGDPASGLLKWVEKDHGRPVGAADGCTQAYNYRYYTTDDPATRIPITAPPGYDPRDFELVGRYVGHLVATIADEKELFVRLARIFPGWKNSGEWNYHRDSLFSMSPVGVSQDYAAGDWAAKARVWKLHQDYLRGLHEFMSTDPRVPEAFRRQTAAIGLDPRFHPDTQGWPHQLYIRVARRLKGPVTITAHDVYNRTTVDDPVGLAQYGIDTYPARRIAFERDGRVRVGLEGKMFIGGGRGPTDVPYPIPYRALTPVPEECVNLLVPVCFSASHLGYASARMEPVFMICGESAGIAAVRAIAEGVAVQAIDAAALRAALEKAEQKLVWDGPVPPPGSRPSSGGYTFGALLDECDRNGDRRVTAAEWDAGKGGWEWLFPHIDRSADGSLDEAEYAAFQDYKAKTPDWARELRKTARP